MLETPIETPIFQQSSDYTVSAGSIINTVANSTSTISTNYPYVATANYPYTGTVTYPYTIFPYVYPPTATNININMLKSLECRIEFEVDNDDMLLKNNVISIKNKKISFNCNYIGNRIQPYEFIMKLIEEEKKFSIKIKIPDVLSICYKNFQFISIQNNLNFNINCSCDFSVLVAKFKYEKILYENNRLSNKEIRSDKIKKICQNEEK
jgi:hypothetical protein